MEIQEIGKIMDKDEKKEGRLGVDRDPYNAIRIHGRITGIHPPKRNSDGDMKGGYIWVQGDDGVAYFGHITQFKPGVNILDLRIDQECSFLPSRRFQGPAAELLEFEF
jgi:hypothetical protein